MLGAHGEPARAAHPGGHAPPDRVQGAEPDIANDHLTTSLAWVGWRCYASAITRSRGETAMMTSTDPFAGIPNAGGEDVAALPPELRTTRERAEYAVTVQCPNCLQRHGGRDCDRYPDPGADWRANPAESANAGTGWLPNALGRELEASPAIPVIDMRQGPKDHPCRGTWHYNGLNRGGHETYVCDSLAHTAIWP